MPRTPTGLIAPAALALAIVALSVPVGAQTSPSGAMKPGAVGRPTVGTAPDQRPRERAPPALPGSRAEPAAVTPADRNAAELPPTEALFDAINRGDTPAARDAINRGADLSGHNVLGLTPLELAVDLGRNDITFVLLSMRGGETSGPPAGAGGPGATSARETAAERRVREREAREQRRRELLAARGARTQPSGTAQPTGPRLFARDGGAPVPQAGFLGFDPVR